MSNINHQYEPTGSEIAIIGMDGRFPGAENIDRLWEVLKNGEETIAFFSEEDLIEKGVTAKQLENPNYVRCGGGMLQGKEFFDADFFDYTPREAEIMDPHLRLFHECAWTVMENAGYDPFTYTGSVGVYAGSASSVDWETLMYFSGKNAQMAGNEANFLMDSHYMAARISYKLNLRGPCFTLYTACSTSLVAIHLGCQAILDGECDMALAGGATVTYQRETGYYFLEGNIISSDGHNRTFDADADGTIFANGVSVVLLKALEDAIADGDTIHAVIKGTAVNNDGLRKIGFTAPSVEGQAEVIKIALKVAEVDPETITMVEAHGTATQLGDPVEMEALKIAYDTDKRNYCAVGSLKSNMGHMDCASGAAGLIKVVLALKHRQIPPSLHFKTPNPKIDFENSPFFVNTELKEWVPEDNHPLRGAVSSLGIGGTNAHAILEEAPRNYRSASPPTLDHQLLLLSAKSPQALDRISQNLANFFQDNPDIDFANAVYTLKTGRSAMPYRRTLVAQNNEDAAQALKDSVSNGVAPAYVDDRQRPVIFMFSGQGSQYVNMGLELYQKIPQFREEMDRCFQLLNTIMGEDAKQIIYPPVVDDVTKEKINWFVYTSPLKFSFEYSLAKLLIHYGITPYAMVGHSFGEYVAACLAGVFSLEDALILVALRGKLMHELPEGAMLSVPISEADLIPLLEKDVSLAAINGTEQCIVSGPTHVIEAFEEKMKAKDYECVRLRVPRAGHSDMMTPALGEFEAKAAQLTLNKPQIPYISGLSGQWISVEEATAPRYWARHLREAIRFGDGLSQLLKIENAIFVQVGSDRSLSSFTEIHPDKTPAHSVLNLVRHPKDEISDCRFLLDKLGQLWQMGKTIDWSNFYGDEERYRIPLPTYPFEKRKFPFLGDPFEYVTKILTAGSGRSMSRKEDPAEWFYAPSWVRTPLSASQDPGNTEEVSWLIFIDDFQVGSQIIPLLQTENRRIISVSKGTAFSSIDDASIPSFTLNPGCKEEYSALLKEIKENHPPLERIVHLWSISGEPHGNLPGEEPDVYMENGLYSLVYLTQALSENAFTLKLYLDVVSDHLRDVYGDEPVYPGKALLDAPLRVIPQEYSHIRCRSIDILLPPSANNAPPADLIHRLAQELPYNSAELVVAYRGPHRWEQTFKQIKPNTAVDPTTPPPILKEEGVYLITGGLGGMSLLMAQYLARTCQAKLVLTGRSSFPDPSEYSQWLENHDDSDDISQKIKILETIEKLGSKVVVHSADVTDPEAMREVVARTEKEFGPINGVIHAAGLSGGGVIQLKTPEMMEDVLAPKINGTRVLANIFIGRDLDFVFLCSSVNVFIPRIGQLDYVAANNFLDAAASSHLFGPNTLTMSVNWDRWRNTGMALAVEQKHKELTGEEFHGGISAKEAIEAFHYILSSTPSRVVVYPSDFEYLMEVLNREVTPQKTTESDTDADTEAGSDAGAVSYDRPNINTPYEPPVTDTHKRLVKIWQGVFGYGKIGIRDGFFELGGDSLKSIFVTAKIHKELNIKVPIADFFKYPTIEELAQYMDGMEETTYEAIPRAEERDYYPLSSAQNRLYILQRMEPRSTAYNIPLTVPIPGKPRIEVLESAFQKAIQRHESLRTSFLMINGEPMQKIHPHVDFKLEYVDLTAPIVESDDGEDATGAEPKTTTASFAQVMDKFIRPYDLSKAPLLRAIVIDAGNKGSILAFDLHHIISDVVSQNILNTDFISILRGKEPAPLRLQYKDYSQWQNSEGTRAEMKKQEEHWLKRFSGEIPVIALPCDYPRPELQSFEGGTIMFHLNPKKINALRSFASQQNSTIFILLLTIYNIFLSKITGQEDIVVGSPVVGRRHADLEEIMGIFINTLALRNQPEANKTITQFLQEVKTDSLNDFENQDYQFENLVEAVNVNRDTSRNPLFDAMMTLESMEGGIEEAEGMKERDEDEPAGMKSDNDGKEQMGYQNKTAKVDLTLIILEFGRYLRFEFQYCNRLFRPDTIRRFVQYFKSVVNAVIDNPQQTIAQIDVMTEEEKQQLLVDFNDTAADYPQEKTIHQLFHQQAEKAPEKIAATFAGQSITYRQLDEETDRLGGILREKGIVPGTIAAVMVERSLKLVTGILAVLKAGGAYLPIDTGYPDERKHYMLEDSRAALLLTTRQTYPENNETNAINTDILYLNDSPEDTGSETATSISDISSKYPANATDIAYIIYTSGSTGKPKGVMVQHGPLVNYITWAASNYVQDQALNFPLYTSISFDLTVTSLFTPLTTGNTLIIYEDTDGVVLINQIMDNPDIGVVKLTPAHLKAIRGKQREEDSTEGVKRFIVGGEEFETGLAQEIHDNFSGTVELCNEYGPTEAVVGCMLHRYSPETDTGISVPIGTPAANMNIFLLDKELKPVPTGVSAEMFISGPCLALGYLNRPEITTEKFIDNPLKPGTRMYRTGDLARFLPNGTMQFLGRIDEQVKIRGHRIELGEIENKLLTHPHLKDAVVLVKKDESGDKFLAAYIVPESGIVIETTSPPPDIESTDTVQPAPAREDTGGVNIPKIRSFLSAQLPEYMIPAHFITMEAIPLTANGKVNRKALPDIVGSRPVLESVFVAPENDNEKIIADIWQEVLGLEKVGIYDNFFEIGGNSLKIIQINSKMNEAFQREISIATMFRCATVVSLAQFLDQEDAAARFAEKSDRTDALKRGKKDRMQRLQKRRSNK